MHERDLPTGPWGPDSAPSNPEDLHAHELFELWAARTPDALAVSGGGVA